MAKFGTDGLSDPTVVPPNDPSLKPKPKSGAVDKSLRPKARTKDAARVGNGTVDKSLRPRAREERFFEKDFIRGMKPTKKPDKESSTSPKQFEPMKPTLENKRGFTPGEQKPPKRGGDFRPPEILGRPSKPQIDIIKFKNGGCVMKKTNQKVFMG